MADDEDDYLSMTFAEPARAKHVNKESSLQRTQRLKREAAKRSRPLPKAEQAAKEEAARNVGLATKLDGSNKGAQLMAKMGFKGGALGSEDNRGRENPIEVLLKDDRGGIGMDNEKKRKMREAAEANDAATKRSKIDEQDFRERNKQEREEKRAEGQWWSAMKVLQGFVDDIKHETAEEKISTASPYSLLIAPLIQDRRTKEEEQRRLKLLHQNLPRLDTYDDEDDADDLMALPVAHDDELESIEDAELEAYEELPAPQRLGRVLDSLRDHFFYCFWCKYKYADKSMEGCPGLTEDEHG